MPESVRNPVAYAKARYVAAAQREQAARSAVVKAATQIGIAMRPETGHIERAARMVNAGNFIQSIAPNMRIAAKYKYKADRAFDE